jgi:hypothetical protein
MTLDWLQDSAVGGLILGAYAWTYSFVSAKTKNQATKDDVKDLRERVNTLYEHLLNRPMPNPSNGKKEK